MVLRVIPRLDIKGPNLVKGVHLEGLRVLGNPEKFAAYYFNGGADEIFYQDVVASLYDRNSLKDFVSKSAQNIFVPLTVGGGIRSLSDINDLLKSGADKVSINTAALKRPEFISEAAKEFGSSTICVSIEAIKDTSGVYYASHDNGREGTNYNVIDWVRMIEDLGAGEVFFTSVQREGTQTGLDFEIINVISKRISVPLVIHGGLGKMEDMINFKTLPISGISAASVFHYNTLSEGGIELEYNEEGNYDYLKYSNGVHGFVNYSIRSLKEFLFQKGFNIRMGENDAGWNY